MILCVFLVAKETHAHCKNLETQKSAKQQTKIIFELLLGDDCTHFRVYVLEEGHTYTNIHTLILMAERECICLD